MTQLNAVDLERSAAVDTARHETPASATAHTFAASLIAVAIALAIGVVIARLLGPSLKGTYDLAMASAGMLALVLGLALPTGIVFSVSRGLAAPRRVATFVLVFGGVQVVAAWVLLSATQSTTSGAAVLPTGESQQMRTLVAVVAGAAAMAASMKAIVMGRQQVARANWIDLGGRVLMLLFVGAVGLTLAGATPSVELLVGGAAGATLATVLALGIAAVRHTEPGGPLHLAEGVRVAVPSYAANILQFLNYRLDLFLLALFWSSAEVGLYALAVTIAQLIWLLSNASGSALFPRVAAGNDDLAVSTARTERFSRFAMASALAMAVPMAVLAAPLLRIVYGSDYESAALPMLLLLPGIVVFAPVNVLASHLAGIGRPKFNLVVSAASLVVTVILDLLLIPVWGMLGAAAASSASYLAAACVMVLIFRHVVGSSPRDLLVPTSMDLAIARDRLRLLASR